VLSGAEQLPEKETLFWVVRRYVERKDSKSISNVFFGPTIPILIRKSAVKSLSDLRHRLSSCIEDLVPTNMWIAYYQPNAWSWKEFKDSAPRGNRARRAKSKHKGQSEFENLGDRTILAVKDKTEDPDRQDDWRTPYDRYMIRHHRPAQSSTSTTGTTATARSSEAVLSIEVDEF